MSSDSSEGNYKVTPEGREFDGFDIDSIQPHADIIPNPAYGSTPPTKTLSGPVPVVSSHTDTSVTAEKLGKQTSKAMIEVNNELDNTVQKVSDFLGGVANGVVDSVTMERNIAINRGVMLRKLTRVLTTTLLWLLLLGCYALFDAFRTFEETAPFDPSSTLQIDVGGCDVHFKSGSSATITLKKSLLHQGSDGGYALDYDNQQEFVYNVYAKSDGCDIDPRGRCKRTCNIEVSLPIGPAVGWGNIYIRQLPESRGRIVVDADFFVFFGPQISVFGDEVAVRLPSPTFNSKFVFKVSGPIDLSDVRFNSDVSGSVTAVKHSVYFTSLQNDVDYSLRLRQPDGRYSLRYNDNITAGGLITDPSITCPVNVSTQQTRKLVGFYDTNSDGYIEVEEFRDTVLNKVPMCCTANCPLPLIRWASRECDSLVSEFYPAVSTYPVDTQGRSRYGQLTNGEFVNAIQSYADTGLVPYCYDTTTLSVPIATNSISLTMAAPEGAIETVVTPNAFPATEIEYKEPPITMKLDTSSAAKLRLVANEYGHRNNERDIYLNIIADRGPTVGTEYFVYSSRIAFLTSLTPAILKMVGASALLPDMDTVYIHFTLGPEFYDADPVDLDAIVPTSGPDADPRVEGINCTYRTMIQIQTYAQLQTALTPPGQLALKGQLVRIQKSDGSDFGSGSRLKHFAMADDITVDNAGVITQFGIADNFDQDNFTTLPLIAEVEYVALQSDGVLVIALNFAISIILGSAIFCVGSTYAKDRIRARYRANTVSKKVLATGDEASSVDEKELSQLMKVDVGSKYFMPLELPIEVINIIIPYREIAFDSLRKFFTTRFETVGDDFPPGTPVQSPQRSVPYEDFIDSYEQHCFKHHLKVETNHLKIRQYLYLGEKTSNWCSLNFCKSKRIAARDNMEQSSCRIRLIDIAVIAGLKLNTGKINLLDKELEKVKNMEAYTEQKAGVDRSNLSFATGKLVTEAIESFKTRIVQVAKYDNSTPMNESSVVDAFISNLSNVDDGIDMKKTRLLMDVLAMNSTFKELLDRYQPGHQYSIRQPPGIDSRIQARFNRISEAFDQSGGNGKPGSKLIRAFLTHCCTFSEGESGNVGGTPITEFVDAYKIFRDFAITFDLVDDCDRLDGKNNFDYNTWSRPKFIHAIESFDENWKPNPNDDLFAQPSFNDAFHKLGLTLKLLSRQYIVGIRFIDLKEVPVTSLFMKEVFIDTFIHLFYVLAPAIFLLFVAFEAQFVYARTDGIVNTDTVDQSNINSLSIKHHDRYYTTSFMIIVAAVTGTIITLTSILYSYIVWAQDKFINVIFRRLMGFGIAVYYLFVLTFIIMVLMWVLVAAILEPGINLVNGVAILTVLLTVYRVGQRLVILRRNVRDEIHDNLTVVMNDNINKTWRMLQDKKGATNIVAAYHDTKKKDTITLENIFDLLDKQEAGEVGHGQLDFDEFSELFDYLGFNINETLERNMFAFADVMNTGSISKAEFDTCASYLQEVIADKVEARLHLSNGDIMVAVIAVISIFILVLPFLFITIQLYSNQDNFATVIHSLVIGLTGVFAGSRGTRIEEQATNKDKFFQKVIRLALENMGL